MSLFSKKYSIDCSKSETCMMNISHMVIEKYSRYSRCNSCRYWTLCHVKECYRMRNQLNKNECALKTHLHSCTFLWFMSQHIITLRTSLNSDFDCSYIKNSAVCLPVISQRVTQDSLFPCNKPEVEGGTAEVAFDCCCVPRALTQKRYQVTSATATLKQGMQLIVRH